MKNLTKKMMEIIKNNSWKVLKVKINRKNMPNMMKWKKTFKKLKRIKIKSNKKLKTNKKHLLMKKMKRRISKQNKTKI